mgnify:FL=1
MEYLKNDIYIHKDEEIIKEEINDKNIDITDDKNTTISTQENTINEINEINI